MIKTPIGIHAESKKPFRTNSTLKTETVVKKFPKRARFADNKKTLWMETEQQNIQSEHSPELDPPFSVTD